MSGWHLAALIGVVTAGVLLAKALPAALAGRTVGGPAERFLSLLPAALLGGLAVVSVLGSRPGFHPQPAAAIGAAVAAGLAIFTRRTLLAMAGGWVALALVLAVS